MRLTSSQEIERGMLESRWGHSTVPLRSAARAPSRWAVAEEHPQRPSAVSHSALGQPSRGSLDDVRAEDGRRQLAVLQTPIRAR